MARKKSSAAKKDEAENGNVVSLKGGALRPADALGLKPEGIPGITAPPIRDFRKMKLKGDVKFRLPKMLELDTVEAKLFDAIEPTLKELAEKGVDEAALIDDVSAFLKGYRDRYDEANPPSVPRRKFVPRKDHIIPFLREVWGEWLDWGRLSKSVLKDHDPKAYDALTNWQKTNDLPKDISIGTVAQMNDRFLQRRYFALDEVVRASAALTRRKKN